ncbi:DNA translocase FtsK [Candidatus Saccharibacteria bacterium]|nr:DNA translocase FtsK [Candidatus Saccharibacteria bacterium]MCB9821207.1 DNA translocase FtsK [Candidatus Nomurabacteria bacterium]
MAKKKSKKKSAAKKKAEVTEKKSSPLLRQSFAFILIIIALFVLFGSFGQGGALPVGLFKMFSWLVGYTAYIVVPTVIVYLAIQKFKHEDNIIPFSKLASAVVAVSMLAGMLHVYVDRKDAASLAGDGSYGGQIGHFVSSVLLTMLGSNTAFILLVALTIIFFLFTFGVSPKRFFGAFIKLFKRTKAEDSEESDEVTDLAQLKGHKQAKFELHEGVPVENHHDEPADGKRLSSFKNSVEQLAKDENHEALTIAADEDWQFPNIDLLNQKQDKADAGDVQENAEIIRETLANFNIDAQMEGANIGPRVTQYTLRPPSGTKLTRITGLESNIALDLAAQSIRIEAPIPGKRAVGIEVPNKKAATVRLSGVLSSKEWAAEKNGLAFAIGRDISGSPIVERLEQMPHLLIAGQTGSGKSVMINNLLTSLLFHKSPSQMKLILVDPKQVELTPYSDIPHLLTPVIHEPEKCVSALKWAVAEMERRLRAFAEVSKRNIVDYNSLKTDAQMPYIVIVIDELADLMMVAARDVEALVVRLAQKARAAGIHLVLATQRPSVDVITGLIKANVPARIAFTTASQVDSRTILDQIGAEKLLGLGDMLFTTATMPKPKRVQGAFIGDEETVKVCDFLRDQRTPQYDDEVVSMPVQLHGRGSTVVGYGEGTDTEDDMWRDAVQVVIDSGKASTSLLQRRLRIGYARAARIIEAMEEQGIIGQADGSRPRDVLVSSADDVFGGGGSHEFDDFNEPSVNDDGEQIDVHVG